MSPRDHEALLAHGEQTASLGAVDAVPALLAALTLAVYAEGLRVLWRRAPGRRTLPRWRAAATVIGVVVATAAVISPVDHLAHELFAAHMVQHLALATVAAPLLVLGRPVLVAGVALGHRLGALTGPVRRWAVRSRGSVATVVALGALHVGPWYVWHVPAAYDVAVTSPAVHVVEHLTLLASGAALAWLAVGRLPTLPALVAVGAGMASMGLVAALLVLAPTALYDSHTQPVLGLSPVESQQLGGALMWFPASLAYLVAGGVLAHRLAEPEPARARRTPAPSSGG